MWRHDGCRLLSDRLLHCVLGFYSQPNKYLHKCILGEYIYNNRSSNSPKRKHKRETALKHFPHNILLQPFLFSLIFITLSHFTILSLYLNYLFEYLKYLAFPLLSENKTVDYSLVVNEDAD